VKLLDEAISFGMRVKYYDEIRHNDLERELSIEFVPFDDLLRNSDVLSIHVPLNQKTKGMINENSFKIMKSNAVIVNTARGAIVDESALSRALTEKWIGGAAIHVYSEEPLTPRHPFYKLGSSLPNLIVTEHSISMYMVKAMIRTAAEEVVSVLSGHEPKICDQ
jgi:phosphoglycerate dehydrogenase-like enzyme